MSWISVEDFIPEKQTDVIVYSAENESVRLAYYDLSGEFWDVWADQKIKQVTHWQPVPPDPS